MLNKGTNKSRCLGNEWSLIFRHVIHKRYHYIECSNHTTDLRYVLSGTPVAFLGSAVFVCILEIKPNP